MNTQLIDRTEPPMAVTVDAAATPPVVDAAQERRSEGSWLCPSANARERMLDMDARLAPVRGLTLAALALVALSQAHWIGLWTLIPLIPAAAGSVRSITWVFISNRVSCSPGFVSALGAPA